MEFMAVALWGAFLTGIAVLTVTGRQYALLIAWALLTLPALASLGRLALSFP
jgi:hypothetical protein